MRRTQEVLDAIDGALSDWTVSDDAMRWVPTERDRQAEAVRHAAIRRHRQQRHDSLVVPSRSAGALGTFASAVRNAEDMERAAANLRAALEVSPEARENFRRLMESFGLHVQQVSEVVQRAAEQMGKSATELANQWATSLRAIEASRSPSGRPRPAPTLRDTDPAAFALQCRQTRGTGPNRQVQREHRPRRTS